MVERPTDTRHRLRPARVDHTDTRDQQHTWRGVRKHIARIFVALKIVSIAFFKGGNTSSTAQSTVGQHQPVAPNRYRAAFVWCEPDDRDRPRQPARVGALHGY